MDQNIRLQSLSDIGKKYGLNPDYLRVLISRKKLKAEKVNAVWMTTNEWIEEYQTSAHEWRELQKTNGISKIKGIKPFVSGSLGRYEHFIFTSSSLPEIGSMHKSRQSFFVLATVFIVLIIIGAIVITYRKQKHVTEFPIAKTAVDVTRQTNQAPIESNNTAIVSYGSEGFSPDTVMIKKGDTVLFKNESADDIWPASDPHPAHTAYPAKGGCIGSTFDACAKIPPGGSWIFIFDIAGTWKYHDHLNSRRTGTVIVQ